MDTDTLREQVKTAQHTRGWTLHLKQRRARVYAARRIGTRTEDRYLAPLDDLPSILARVAALPNGHAPDVGQPLAKHELVQANDRDPERLRTISELLELGRRMGYRRFIVVPF